MIFWGFLSLWGVMWVRVGEVGDMEGYKDMRMWKGDIRSRMGDG